MTTKQILLATLILGAINNSISAITRHEFKQMKAYYETVCGLDCKKALTAHEKNSTFEYPTLPTNQCDYCNFDSNTYQEQYQAAVNREMNIAQTSTEYYNMILRHRDEGLACNLDTIKQQKKLCLIAAKITAEREKKSEQFADLISQLNHEQQ